MNDDKFDDLFNELPELRISDAAREQHLRLINQLTTQTRVTPHRWRKWAIVMTAAVGFSGVGLGTAAALGLFASPTDRRIAYCYTTADLHDPTNREDFSVATSPQDTNPSLHDAAASALDICAGGWQQGRFSATDPKISLDPKAPPWNHPIPHLVACVLPNGAVGVLPGSVNTCTDLGLPNVQP